jgi:glutamate carboxypeptidase
MHPACSRRAKPKVLAAAKACDPAARALLQQLVQIDSGTGDVAGLTAIGTVLKTELEHLGANVESVPALAPAVGDNLVATLTGTGRGRASYSSPTWTRCFRTGL